MMRLSLLITATLMIAACSEKTQHRLGLYDAGPDEYQVKRSKSLEVPPFYQKALEKKENSQDQ